MARQKKKIWGCGDYFSMPLVDGTYGLGQVVSHEPEAMNSALCTFFARRFEVPPVRLLSIPADVDLLSVLFVTRDLLDSGGWKVFEKGEARDVSSYVNLHGLRTEGFVGTRIIGSGNVTALLEAYYRLRPWNDFYEPDYLDSLLISIDKKPADVVLK